MSSNEVLQIWYKAVGQEGAVLYESEDLKELIHMCQGKHYTIFVKTKRLVVSDWDPMSSEDQEQVTQAVFTEWTNSRR